MVTFSNNSKKYKAAVALAFGESKKEAAKKAGVTAGTISEYMKDPAFKAKINEIQKDTLTRAQDKFRSQVMSAVDTVSKIMAESDNDRVKLDAAKYIIDRVQIAPHKDAGLWVVGPTTEAEVESEEHIKAMRKRMREIREELQFPSILRS